MKLTMQEINRNGLDYIQKQLELIDLTWRNSKQSEAELRAKEYEKAGYKQLKPEVPLDSNERKPYQYLDFEFLAEPFPVLHVVIKDLPEIPFEVLQAGLERTLTGTAHLPQETLEELEKRKKDPSKHQQNKYKNWYRFTEELSTACELVRGANAQGLMGLLGGAEDARVHILFNFADKVKKRLTGELRFIFKDILAMPQNSVIDNLVKAILKECLLNEVPLPNVQTGEKQLLTELIPLPESKPQFRTRYVEKEGLSLEEIQKIKAESDVIYEDEEVLRVRESLALEELTDKQKALKVIMSPISTEELGEMIDLTPILPYLPVVAVTAFFFSQNKALTPHVYRGDAQGALGLLSKRVEETHALMG
jgi:hypothetical protein